MKHALAAALVLALPLTLPTPAAFAQAQATAPLTQAQIRSAVGELATLMEQSYVFPDVARQYAAHLRARASAGGYDALTDPAQLAATLQAELRGVHQDAHLRVTLVDPNTPRGPRGPRLNMGDPLGQDAWLAPGVAYLRINNLLGGADWGVRTGEVLDRYAAADTLILDLRRCPGGGLEMMDPLFARIYARPTHVMTMDTRTGANPGLEDMFRNSPTMRLGANPPAGVTRFEHWAQPQTPPHNLADARIFVLTGRTGSACEHLAQALRETGRATLVGSNTGGAGHYGGDRVFGDGRFQVFLPVGVSYAPGAQSWEGVGVAPHRQVEPDQALNVVLQELGLPASAGAVVIDATPPQRVVEGAPPTRRYGIAMAPPQHGAQFLEVQNVDAGAVAARAGLRPGDRIVSLNGRAVSDIPHSDLPNAMRASPMTMVIERNGQRQTIQMSLDG